MIAAVRLLLLLSVCFHSAHGFIEGLYCGLDNCYEALDVTREATKPEISRAFRQLARKYHPDKYKGPDPEEADRKFKLIATAYEILRDEDQRRDYNYMLDHPDEVYRHYYYYYTTRYAPKVDPRIVVVVTITVISFIQYFGWWQQHHAAINYFVTVPKYRQKALLILGDDENNKKLKGREKKSKQELKEEKEKAIRKVIEENMDIRGGHSKPKVTDVLWVQLILLPYYIVSYVLWYARWVWKFNFHKEEYGDKEKLYIIRKFLKLSQTQFECLEESKKSQFLDKKLWVKEHFTEYKKIRDEEQRVKLAQDSKYKSYRRYVKNNGVGRMYFDD